MQTCLQERCFAVEPGVNTQALFPKKADGYHFHYNDLFFSLCSLARATTLQVSSLRAQNPTTSKSVESSMRQCSVKQQRAYGGGRN